ncbi:MAG: chemotaxis protein CheA [Burkholderiales bacterium]|nr:chemotaxis protein CheA [Burkholderiales bacterium]
MNLDEALDTFVAEAEELLGNMEDALLGMKRGSAAEDAIHAIFRAAHTIKGSAGLFGLDFVVGFTHTAESVLDLVRAGELEMDAAMVELMLEVCDHLGSLISLVRQGDLPDADLQGSASLLTARLQNYLEKNNPPSLPEVEAAGVVSDCWHISLRFGQDVLRYGMDPFSFIRYLGKMGRIVGMHTLTDGIPRLSAMDPESCHLGFEIRFESAADKETIESVFDFVKEDCRIVILAPHSMIEKYRILIEELPEDDMLLGEILVKCGSLTQNELDAALRIQASAPIGEVLVGQGMVRAPVVEAALEKQKQGRDAKAGEVSLIRVDSSKLDRLIDLVGELIIVGSSASLFAQRSGVAELLEITSSMSRMVEEVRDTALSLRMVQIGATFNRFQRVVHDVSRELGKDIRLEIGGAETELDKVVVEKIADPLTHLVRNSMDHGIEPEAARIASGKPACGTLKLNAYHDSGSIVIEVSDDGGGLNREKILKKAIEKGIVAADANLADQEICQLIFEAGFSTADKVSNLSGRGVGMDVVRRNIQDLRGSIELDSVEGQGTTTRIRLPLTLSIIDGCQVAVGKSSYVIPLDMVIECIEFEGGQDEAGQSGYLNLRGEVLPYLRLREYFEVDEAAQKRQNVVVVQYAGRRAGLVVDSLLGELQTVIKPLGRMFGGVKGIGGFTILGSGEVALILDVQRLLQQAEEREQKNSGRNLTIMEESRS